MPNPSTNGMFGLDADELMFPNMTATAIKQEEPDYMLPLELTNQMNNATTTVNNGGILRQLVDAEKPVEDMQTEINETSLVEGKHSANSHDQRKTKTTFIYSIFSSK